MKEILFHCFLLNPADLSIIYRYCNDNTLYVNRHILNKAKDFFSNLSILSGIDSNNFIMSYFSKRQIKFEKGFECFRQNDKLFRSALWFDTKGVSRF